jgi:hypothetical protein
MLSFVYRTTSWLLISIAKVQIIYKRKDEVVYNVGET